MLARIFFLSFALCSTLIIRFYFSSLISSSACIHRPAPRAQVIPQNMFRILNDIIRALTFDMRALPMKLERLHLKEFAQVSNAAFLSEMRL